uniref:Uncharacterized protein n=1 Tax=Panagrolaimus superbus TaxID=310955 RepID=A0A914Z743_9BILA
MNCCCFKTFFVFLCFQLGFLDSILAAKLQRHENVSNDSFILNSNDAINEQLPSDNLLADGSVRAIADGNDIRLSGYGSINLTLTLETLQFEVCDICEGSSKVCFDTAKVHSKAACSEYSSYCKFEVKYEKDEQTRAERIYFNDIWVSKNDFVPRCLRPTMHWGEVVAVETSKFMSCDPKIDGVDKIIKLYVGIEPSCPIKVINAKIYVPEVSTKNSSSNSTSADESSAASAPVWAIVIMVLGGIAVIIIIGGFA